MWRAMRLAGCVFAITFVMSGLALAQYGYDGDYRQSNISQARQYGYQNGYNDGVSRGRHEGRERDPNDSQIPSRRQARRGYQRWMGPVGWYQHGYQEGYSDGFRSGYRSVAGRWGYGDRDYGWGRGGYYPNRTDYAGYERNVAYRFGYEDGSTAAREDIYHGKAYNSRPRGRFDDCDHGYRREYGSKDQYRAEYANAYRNGYDSVMGNGY